MNEENKKNKEFKLDIKYIALIFVIAVIACIATAGATLSRYVTQTDAYFDDGKEVHEYLDFTVNSVFEVRNQMDLFAAINQGYSFIRLSQEIENPLIVTQNAETLDSDLILDLNGIEIQRNGYQPILNIQPGVRLTVVDTSDEGTGGLYNPVGSVFNITGGTLTISTGHFESGPRYSEYYSYNTEVIREDDALVNKRTIVLPDEQPVHFHQGVKGADGKYSYGDPIERIAPIIRSYPLDVGNITYTHGNLYFDKAYDGATLDIPVDTYVYYRTSEDVIDGKQEMIELSCDWYYMYWVDPDFNYLCAEESQLVNFADQLAADGYTVDDCVEIAIYGYQNVIEEASKIPAEKNYYAAIQMSSGTLEVKDGQFFSYFGVPTTACVNAIGGEINVVKGKFSSRIPNATEQVANEAQQIDKKHEDVDAFGTAYFDKYNWNTTDANGALAMAGESYCILNSGNADVSIGEGDFRSSNNNTIKMSSGKLTVGGGSFAKQQNYFVSTNAPTAVGEKTACILMLNGVLDVGASTYTVTGDYNAGILMNDGALTVNDAVCNIEGVNSIGVFMNEGVLDIENADFDIAGDKSAGIIMLAGTLTIDEATCEVSGSETYGIYSTVSGNDSFKLTNASFTLTGGNYQTGIYAENGRVQVTGTTAQTINLSGSNSYGIHVENGGSVLSTGYSYKLAGGKSTGIYSAGGSVTVNDGDITLDSNDNCYGVYVNTNDLIEMKLNNATIDVGYTNNTGMKSAGTYDASVGVYLSTDENQNKIALHNSNVYCYEVGIAVSGGSLELTGNGVDSREIKTRKASAMVVIDGNLTFDSNCDYTVESYAADDNYTNTSEYTTYQENVGGQTVTFRSFDNDYNINLDIYSESSAYPNLDGVYVSGGNFIANGNMNITHTGQMSNNAVANYGSYVVGYNYTTHTVKSFAVRILNGNCTLTKGQIVANVGGGVYCNNTDMAKEVILGQRNANNTEMKVTTTGTVTGTRFPGMGSIVNNADGWYTNINLSGGHAVLAEGGKVTINSGSYRTAYGNGVYVKFAPGQTGEVTVYDGDMYGGMTESGKSGPSACYGLNVNGGATVNIYGGTFDGYGGGALVTGINSFTNRTNFSGEWAEVYVYEGTFASESSTDGFYVLDKAKVALGAYNEETARAAGKTISSDLIKINADIGPISVNQIGFNSGTTIPSYVYAFYGQYGNDAGSRDTAWNEGSFSWIIAYNASAGNSIGALSGNSSLVKVVYRSNARYITYGNKVTNTDGTESYTYYTTLGAYGNGYNGNPVYFDKTYFFDNAETNFENVGKA